jgi:hypothetical protein
VWEGSDSELLEAIFSFYAIIAPEPILDSTYNTGRIWKGSSRQVISMDIDRRYKPMIAGDNRKMTGVPDAALAQSFTIRRTSARRDATKAARSLTSISARPSNAEKNRTGISAIFIRHFCSKLSGC